MLMQMATQKIFFSLSHLEQDVIILAQYYQTIYWAITINNTKLFQLDYNYILYNYNLNHLSMHQQPQRQCNIQIPIWSHFFFVRHCVFSKHQSKDSAKKKGII